MKDKFRLISNKVSSWTGSAWAFVLASSIVIVWALTGPIFHFSPTWQLVINTGTTIVTFLMVVLIQSTQNRDGKALQLKLDELIRASIPARDNFIDLEDMTDEELTQLDEEFKKLHTTYQDLPPKVVHKFHKKIVAARSRRQV